MAQFPMRSYRQSKDCDLVSVLHALKLSTTNTMQRSLHELWDFLRTYDYDERLHAAA